MSLKRAWLILKVRGTDKVVILKRSRFSNNKKQWDFVGGSSLKKIEPRKLIRKESYEEIGLHLKTLTLLSIVKSRRSTYYYFTSFISKKEVKNLELNYEHSKIKLLDLIKLRKKKRLHHSIKVYLKSLSHE